MQRHNHQHMYRIYVSSYLHIYISTYLHNTCIVSTYLHIYTLFLSCLTKQPSSCHNINKPCNLHHIIVNGPCFLFWDRDATTPHRVVKHTSHLSRLQPASFVSVGADVVCADFGPRLIHIHTPFFFLLYSIYFLLFSFVFLLSLFFFLSSFSFVRVLRVQVSLALHDEVSVGMQRRVGMYLLHAYAHPRAHL